MNILIVNPFGIGDVLFTTPVIRALAGKGHSVYFWSTERTADILRHNPAIKGILPLSRGDLKKISAWKGAKALIGLMMRLRKGSFDAALDFSLDYRYGLLLRMAGIKKRVGFDYKGRGRFLTDAVKIDGFSGRHMAAHYADILRFIDKPLKAEGKMELFVGDEDDKWADRFLRENGAAGSDVLIGITPGGGASWGKDASRKHWPKENFAVVADKLVSEGGRRVVIFGSESESALCAAVAGKMKCRPINTGGKLSLGRFAALLRRCRLLITNDGGPLHMASALGVKTVSVFGPVDEKIYGPYPVSANHSVITGDAACRPCYKNFKYPVCKETVCLNSVGADAVLEAARGLLR